MILLRDHLDYVSTAPLTAPTDPSPAVAQPPPVTVQPPLEVTSTTEVGQSSGTTAADPLTVPLLDNSPLASSSSSDSEDGSPPQVQNDMGDDFPLYRIPQHRATRDHPIENILGDLQTPVRTRNQLNQQMTSLLCEVKDNGSITEALYSCFISQTEPKNVQMALKEPSWVEAMQEELSQFQKLGVWHLVDLPKGVGALGTLWVYR